MNVSVGVTLLILTMQRHHVNLTYGEESVYINSSDCDVQSEIKNLFNNGNGLMKILMFMRSKNCLIFDVCP